MNRLVMTGLIALINFTVIYFAWNAVLVPVAKLAEIGFGQAALLSLLLNVVFLSARGWKLEQS